MGISLDTPAKHPSMFVGSEFMSAIKTQVPVCPKCANRLAIGKNEEFVCVIHGPINKMDNNVRTTPNVPLRMKSLTPAPSCTNIVSNKKFGDKVCGASVMFIEDKWFCECCDNRERLERKQAEMAKEARIKDEQQAKIAAVKDEKTKDSLSVKDDTSSMKVKDDLHDDSNVKQKDKKK